MAGTEAKFFQHLNQNRMDKFSGQPENFEELIFGFAEEFVEGHSYESSSCNSSSVDFDDGAIVGEDDDDDENASIIEEENKAFWASQEDLLLTTLCRTTSIESKIRQATKEAMREINSVGLNCVCEKMVGNSCQNCMHKEISNLLRMAGYNCVVCKSKWRKSSEILSGEHTYMEVMHNSSSSSSVKAEIKIIIELNFRGEFEMGRASEEYNRLINKLPQVFVGKFVRLQNLVKILCAASKKSMKERKMHMAPWRKHKYMLAKWHGSPDDEPKMAANLSPTSLQLGRSTRPRASMLTFDLLDNLQVIPCSPMIRVV